MKRPMPIAIASLFVLTALSTVSPSAAADHCLGNDALESILKPLGQCRNRAPERPWLMCETPRYVNEPVSCSIGGNDPDGDVLTGELDYDDGSYATTASFPSGGYQSLSRSWSEPGTHCVWGVLQDSHGAWGPWTDCRQVRILAR